LATARFFKRNSHSFAFMLLSEHFWNPVEVWIWDDLMNSAFSTPVMNFGSLICPHPELWQLHNFYQCAKLLVWFCILCIIIQCHLANL
jgi:hypothetical protein